MTLTLISIGAMSASLPSWAYHPLDTDDTGTQGRGHWQWEFSSAYAQDREQGIRSSTWNLQATTAYGLSETMDLSLSMPYTVQHIEDEAQSSTQRGRADLAVALKWRYWEHENWSLALAPVLSLPSGDENKGLGRGRLGVGLNLIADKKISERMNWHINLAYSQAHYQLEEERANNARHLWRFSTAVDYTFAEHWKWASDVGISRNENQATQQHPAFWTQALVHSPNPNTDLSLGLKVGLNAPETDVTVLLGWTLRF